MRKAVEVSVLNGESTVVMVAATAGRSAHEESTVASRRRTVADRSRQSTRSITRWYGPCTLDTKDRWRVAGCWPAPANLKKVCFVGFSCDLSMKSVLHSLFRSAFKGLMGISCASNGYFGQNVSSQRFIVTKTVD
ncbi:hypothetical protein Aduo_016115 [Ancylostoma duodenale]